MHAVLLVDDDADIREIGRIALEQVGGLQVRLATSGPEALQAALADPPAVILLDVMMPDLSGPETLHRLRADPRTAWIPVVFLTASVQRQEVARYLELGAVGVIAKPFDPMTLASELVTLLEAS